MRVRTNENRFTPPIKGERLERCKADIKYLLSKEGRIYQSTIDFSKSVDLYIKTHGFVTEKQFQAVLLTRLRVENHLRQMGTPFGLPLALQDHMYIPNHGLVLNDDDEEPYY